VNQPRLFQKIQGKTPGVFGWPFCFIFLLRHPFLLILSISLPAGIQGLLSTTQELIGQRTVFSLNLLKEVQQKLRDFEGFWTSEQLL